MTNPGLQTLIQYRESELARLNDQLAECRGQLAAQQDENLHHRLTIDRLRKNLVETADLWHDAGTRIQELTKVVHGLRTTIQALESRPKP